MLTSHLTRRSFLTLTGANLVVTIVAVWSAAGQAASSDAGKDAIADLGVMKIPGGPNMEVMFEKEYAGMEWIFRHRGDKEFSS